MKYNILSVKQNSGIPLKYNRILTTFIDRSGPFEWTDVFSFGRKQGRDRKIDRTNNHCSTSRLSCQCHESANFSRSIIRYRPCYQLVSRALITCVLTVIERRDIKRIFLQWKAQRTPFCFETCQRLLIDSWLISFSLSFLNVTILFIKYWSKILIINDIFLINSFVFPGRTTRVYSCFYIMFARISRYYSMIRCYRDFYKKYTRNYMEKYFYRLHRESWKWKWNWI